MNIIKYKRKSEIVEAIQWDGENFLEMQVFLKGKTIDSGKVHPGGYIVLRAHDIHAICGIHDWITKDLDGEYTIYSPEKFEKHFEKVV